jgi:hypothetical protein
VAPALLGSGTASSSTFLRGDGTWQPTPNSIPSQTGRAGDVLTTDGSILSWEALTTSQVAESGNLYWTQGRFNTAFAAETTDGLAQGTTNLYWSSSLFNTAFAGKTTDGLAEGATNQYFTAARAIAALPSQTGNSGKFLTTSGSALSWSRPLVRC